MASLRQVWVWISLVALVAVLAVSCRPVKHEMTLGTERLSSEQRLSWPPLPETPRYMFLGELLGVSNFRIAGDDSLNTSGGALRWLVGLDPTSGFPKDLNYNMVRPVSGAVDRKGRIMVTDVGLQAVFVFDPIKGELDIWRKASADLSFSAPAGIAVGPGGSVFIADSALGIVAQLDADGKPMAEIGRDHLKRPVGVAWNPKKGVLYIADAWEDVIKVFDVTGKLVNVITSETDDPLFNSPTHLTFAHNRLYVSDTLNAHVLILDPEGHYIATVGQRGNLMGNMARPKGVAVDSEENIYVVESFFDHLLIYDKEGRFLLPIGGTGQGVGQFYLPNGVWTDAGGRIFIADMFNGRVTVLQFLGGDG